MSYWELETNFPYKVKTFSQQHCTVVKWDQECCLRFANKVPFLFSLCQPSEQRKTWGDSRPISRPASANIIAGKFVRSGQLSSVPFQWKQMFLDSHSFLSYTLIIRNVILGIGNKFSLQSKNFFSTTLHGCQVRSRMLFAFR